MLAFLVAGVILGVLARVLRHGPGDPGPLTAVAVGVVGALVGAAGMNLVLGDGLLELTGWSFTAACIVPFVLLGLLEGRTRR